MRSEGVLVVRLVDGWRVFDWTRSENIGLGLPEGISLLVLLAIGDLIEGLSRSVISYRAHHYKITMIIHTFIYSN